MIFKNYMIWKKFSENTLDMSILDSIRDKMWDILEGWLTLGMSDNDLEPFTTEELERIRSNEGIQNILFQASQHMYMEYENDDDLEDLRNGSGCWDWYKEYLFEENFQYMTRIRDIIRDELEIRDFPLPW